MTVFGWDCGFWARRLLMPFAPINDSVSRCHDVLSLSCLRATVCQKCLFKFKVAVQFFRERLLFRVRRRCFAILLLMLSFAMLMMYLTVNTPFPRPPVCLLPASTHDIKPCSSVSVRPAVSTWCASVRT